MSGKPEIKIIIDPKAGFCGGVKRAIKMVENEFAQGNEVFVRGELIHNEREMERLHSQGLKLCDDIENGSLDKLFIRTHGEAPGVYDTAASEGFDIIDATCRNVRRSQKIISENAADNRNIYLFGKKDHPEIVGLLGYCNGNGIAFQKFDEIADVIVDEPALLIPQTTADPDKFTIVKSKMSETISDLVVYNAICPFVSQRETELVQFAKFSDAVIFIGGKHSSNTAVLFNVCKRANPNAIFAENPDEIDYSKLSEYKSIGISGSASTPMWQLEEIANSIDEQLKDRFKIIIEK